MVVAGTTQHAAPSRAVILALLAATLSTGLAGCGQPGSDTAPNALPASEEATVTGGEPFHGLLPYRKKDAKLALVRPTFIAATDAQLADGVSVVGVTIGDSSRAYPLYVLKNHQIVNDRLGEVPVAASW